MGGDRGESEKIVMRGEEGSEAIGGKRRGMGDEER